MKNIKSILKSIILTGTITILISIPVLADSNDPNILNHYTNFKGDVVTVYKDNTTYINSDVKIQSIDKTTNTVTINKQGELYSFYVDSTDNYYLNEQINITMMSRNRHEITVVNIFTCRVERYRYR